MKWIVLIGEENGDVIKYAKTLPGSNHIVRYPEKDLHPNKQIKTLDHMYKLKMLDSIIILTHSPYILTQINHWITAGRVGKEYPVTTNKIVPEKYWLNDVEAYEVIGKNAISILDTDGLIKIWMVENAITKINKEFDEMMEVLYGHVNTQSTKRS